MGLWDERQPGEGQKAWAAFTVYRDLGSIRSITKAWRKFSTREEGENGRWELWARKFRWVERAAAYDSHLDGQRRLALERRLALLTERQIEYKFKAQDYVEDLVETLRGAVKKHEPAPVTDIERTEDKEVTVKESGVVEVKTVRTRIKGMKTSGLARLSEELRDAVRQASGDLNTKSEDTSKGGSDDGIRELAAAIRNSPE